MLLPREQSAWNCGYALGAIALQALAENSGERADISFLHRKMSAILNRSVSPSQVVAAAAWLYLIDAVKLDEHGELVKCS
jgi:hypothetical protein